MLKITCEMCMSELEEPGGLLFGPPDHVSYCEKIHLCRECFYDLVAFTEGVRYERESALESHHSPSEALREELLPNGNTHVNPPKMTSYASENPYDMGRPA